MKFVARASMLVLLAAALAGCDEDVLQSLCVADTDCGVGFHCRVETGECLCNANAGSGCDGSKGCEEPGACFCNVSGYCQPRNACENNGDCAAGLFCDLSSGNCIEALCDAEPGCARCTQDIHCPIGQVCDQLRFQCGEGCHDTGDCKLGTVCRCPDGGTDCSLGSCIAGRCDHIAQCGTGQDCVTDVAIGETTCQRDPRMDILCQVCPQTPGSEYECPGLANACVSESENTDDPGSIFCGVDCANEKGCPKDFVCGELFTRTRRDQGCSRDADCSASSVQCDTDVDCPGGSWCNPIGHRCHGKCFTTSEAGVEGFCSCVVNADCPRDTCDLARGVCNINVKTCTSSADCVSYCVNYPDVGLCKIGEQCRPKPGFTCAQLRE